MSAQEEAAFLTLRAPAKLNLFLHVVGRRDDGYHLLETLFHFLDLADEITLERTPQPGIERRSGAPGVAGNRLAGLTRTAPPSPDFLHRCAAAALPPPAPQSRRPRRSSIATSIAPARFVPVTC